MNLESVMAHLELQGSDAVKRVYRSHGAREPLFGVKLGDFRGLRKLIGVTTPSPHSSGPPGTATPCI